MNNLKKLAWHYTTGEIFIEIVNSGRLLTTGIGVVPPEKPILWFSTHPHFEPTAIKAVDEGGKIRQLTLPELKVRGKGLVRLGYPLERLDHGHVLRTKAQMSLTQWHTLERVAKLQGSDPNDWYGTTSNQPVNKLVVEVMNDKMEWERVNQA